MVKNIIKKIKNFYKTKFRFDLPISKKILIFDEMNSSILQEIIKKDFSVLKVRDEKEIYFWIFLQQIVFFDFKFFTYCKNYIKFTSPKVIITFIDNNIEFYRLKKNFKNIHFISIQNGIRLPDWFKNVNLANSNNFICDHVFVFNKYILKKYQNIINSKYHILGSLKNNIVKVSKTKTYKDFLFISQFQKKDKKSQLFQENLLKFINLYLLKSGKKLHILLRYKDSLKQRDEIEFYKKIFQSNCIFQKTLEWKKSYQILDKFENIIFMFSTLGYEAIARKKKVAIFSPKKLNNLKYYFGWPSPTKKEYSFFSAKKITYNEIERVLNNINNCSQVNWNRKYYNTLKDQLYLNKNNTKLRKIIFKLL